MLIKMSHNIYTDTAFSVQVKVLKKPRFDLGKLLEMHGESGKSTTATGEDVGSKVDRPDNYEPPVQTKV